MSVDFGIDLESAVYKVFYMLESIGNGMQILDAGGGMKPLTLATHIIDALPYKEACRYGKIADDKFPQRFSESTYLQRDICDTPWPYTDKQFDFVWCTQTIEDVRDPLVVLKELSRVSDIGYLSTIHRSYESKFGVDASYYKYAGYVHHRWLIEQDGNRLKFLFKYPLLHVSRRFRTFSVKEQFLSCWWSGAIEGYEQQLFSMKDIEAELETYASKYK